MSNKFIKFQRKIIELLIPLKFGISNGEDEMSTDPDAYINFGALNIYVLPRICDQISFILVFDPKQIQLCRMLERECCCQNNLTKGILQ